MSIKMVAQMEQLLYIMNLRLPDLLPIVEWWKMLRIVRSGAKSSNLSIIKLNIFHFARAARRALDGKHGQTEEWQTEEWQRNIP